MKPKLRIHIERWNTVEGLFLTINGQLYRFKSFNPTEIMELEDNLYRGTNQGVVIKKLEYQFGEGKKINPEIKKIVQIISNKMDINNPKLRRRRCANLLAG